MSDTDDWNDPDALSGIPEDDGDDSREQGVSTAGSEDFGDVETFSIRRRVNRTEDDDGPEDVTPLFALGFFALAVGFACLPLLGVWSLIGRPPVGAWLLVGAVWISGAIMAWGGAR